MKLKEGSIIEVIGFIMLKGLENGQKYKVARITQKHGKNVYWFSKARGEKIVVGHYASDVDMAINALNNNQIEIIK